MAETVDQDHETISEALAYREGKEILPRKCNNCEDDECADCEDFTNRCPTCRESLDDDYDSEPNFCPNCGQKLIWKTKNGIPLRG